jgi:hypothetical protein
VQMTGLNDEISCLHSAMRMRDIYESFRCLNVCVRSAL